MWNDYRRFFVAVIFAIAVQDKQSGYALWTMIGVQTLMGLTLLEYDNWKEIKWNISIKKEPKCPTRKRLKQKH